MPPPKKALGPASRAKADKRNARLQAKRTADVAESGGAKSGKKKRKMTDLTEEEMPVSGGGSWQRSGEPMFALLEEKQKGRFEAEELALAEEAATFYKRALGVTLGDNERALELQNTYMEYLRRGYRAVLLYYS
jgi:hypothetical protein